MAYGPARSTLAASQYSPYGGAPHKPPDGPRFVRPSLAPVPKFTGTQPTPNTVVLLAGAFALPAGIEADIEEETRQLCIAHCISIPDEVRYVSSTCAFIDFPYAEACKEFVQITNSTITVKQRLYKLQYLNFRAIAEAPVPATVEESRPTVTADGTILDHPTDTIMVRQLGNDIDEADVKKAFQMVVPVVKSVRIPFDMETQRSKGYGFVQFWSVSEAETAMSRMQSVGSMILDRRVSLTFAKPSTQEEALEGEISYRSEQEEIQAQQQQALTGINADLWSSYMSFLEDEKEKEKQADVRKAAGAGPGLRASGGSSSSSLGSLSRCNAICPPSLGDEADATDHALGMPDAEASRPRSGVLGRNSLGSRLLAGVDDAEGSGCMADGRWGGVVGYIPMADMMRGCMGNAMRRPIGQLAAPMSTPMGGPMCGFVPLSKVMGGPMGGGMGGPRGEHMAGPMGGFMRGMSGGMGGGMSGGISGGMGIPNKMAMGFRGW